MAELPGLGDLLLGGYDVSTLLAGAPAHSTGPALLSLEAQLQLKASALPQQTLGWPAASASDHTDIYQKVAQSLAAKLEEHRLQQVQVATALQQLQALQQQQELAQLQQQLSALHQHVPRAANPFQRSRTTDLESLGRGPSYDLAGAYAPVIDFEQQQKHLAALQQAANPTTQLVGLQRIPGVANQHSLPVRSFSSEHLVAGQRRTPPQLMNTTTGQLAMQGPPNTKRPPIRQPSGLGPNGRNGGGGGSGNSGGSGNGRNGDGGRRARYAATAKAPSWASEDWHPMKAVIASGAHASGGTGVFLPHLASGNNNNNNSGANNNNNAAGNGSGAGNGGSNNTAAGGIASGPGGSNHSHRILAAGGVGGVSPAAPQPPASLSSRSSGDHAVGHPLSHPHPPPPPPHGRGAAPAPSAAALHALVSLSGPAGCSQSCSSQSPTHSPVSPSHQLHLPQTSGSSPACSAESNTVCSVAGVDPYSRQTTLEFSRGSSHSELDTSHPPTSYGYYLDPTMKVVVEEPEREEREDAGNEEECDFVSLARELAELISKQVITE